MKDFAAANPGKIIHTGRCYYCSYGGYVGTSCVVPPKYDGALTFPTLITTTKRLVIAWGIFIPPFEFDFWEKSRIENLSSWLWQK